MNTPNPLVPQGTAPAGGKSTVRIAVLTILVVHVALIGGMLIQGCSKETPKTGSSEDPAASTALATNEPYYPVDSNAQPVSATDAIPSMASSANSNVVPLTSTAVAPAMSPMTTPVAPAVTTTAGDYTVVAKDTFAVIAKNHGISVKALEAANPTIEPRKLRPGQKLHLPAATATVAPMASATDSSAPAVAGEGSVYTVKAGDVLARIAKTHHTSVKAIVAANSLKSQNSLRVGQKIKIPAPKASAAPAVPATTEPAAISTASAAPVSPLTPPPAAN